MAITEPENLPCRRTPAPAHRSTLNDIATETGVSLATVSKVVNGRPDVSADTRRRVDSRDRGHGYRRVRREPSRRR